jgi:hypothetical protein
MNYEAIAAIAITCGLLAGAYFFDSVQARFFRKAKPIPRGKGKPLGT